MTDSPSPNQQPKTAVTRQGSPALLRLAIAASILLVEYLAISFSFDAQTVGKRGGVWSILAETGKIGPLLVVGATAFLLLPSLKQKTKGSPAQLGPPSLPLLALHLALASTFVFVTHQAFSGEVAPAGPAILWMLGWATLGATTAISLLVGVLGEWRFLLRSLSRAALAGGALGLVGWLAGTLSTQLWAPLSRATFITVATILQALGFELLVDQTQYILQLEGFAITVAPVCSGFEGIGLFAALMAAFLWRFKGTLRFPNALLLLPVGMLAIWLGNSLRIAALMVVGARLDPEVAIGSFHSKAGWVFFCAITLAIAALARRLAFFSAHNDDAPSKAALKNPTTPLLLPVLTWIGLGLATSSFSEGHDPLYGLRVFGTAAVLWSYRKDYVEYWQKPSLAAWVVGTVVGVAWLLGPLQFSPDEKALTPPGVGWAEWHYQSWLLLRCLGSILIVPLCEELAFRGFLARIITNRDFWKVPLSGLTLAGVLLSSLAFGLVHDQWILGVVTGIAYALLVRRKGRLIEAIAAHAASNAVIAAWVLATGAWQHW